MDLLSDTLSNGVSFVTNASLPIKLSISVGLAFALYYKTYLSRVPQILGKDGSFKKFIQTSVPIVHEKFSPFPLLFGSSLQTISATLLKRCPNITWNEYEDLSLPDSGEVRLWWMQGKQSEHKNEEKPTVILLPGLTGNIESNYIRQYVECIDNLGYRAVVFTYRGMSGQGLKTAKTYCACYTDDMLHVVEHVKNKYPEAPVMAVGISLGAMILSHYLIRTAENSGLLAAMVVSVPWNAFESKKSLTTPFNRLLFNRHLTQNLLRYFESHLDLFADVVNVEQVMQSSTIHEFDESFTARVFGFESLDHYYASATISDKCHKIKTPLLALNSFDDPFSPGYSIPHQQINESEYITMVLTQRGGHVAFIDTPFAQGACYMDRLFEQYVQAVFENKDLIASLNNKIN